MAVKVRDTNQQEHTLLDIGEVAEELNNAKTQITTEITTQLKEEGVVPDLPELKNALLGGDLAGNLQAITIKNEIGSEKEQTVSIPTTEATLNLVNYTIDDLLSTGDNKYGFEEVIVGIVDWNILSSAHEPFVAGVSEIAKSADYVMNTNNTELVNVINTVISTNNLDASKVYFSSSFKINKPFGKFIPDANTGSTNLPAEGKSIEELFKEAFATGNNPVVTPPSIKLTSKVTTSAEVGSTMSSFTVLCEATGGNYSFGPDDTGVYIPVYSMATVPSDTDITYDTILAGTHQGILVDLEGIEGTYFLELADEERVNLPYEKSIDFQSNAFTPRYIDDKQTFKARAVAAYSAAANAPNNDLEVPQEALKITEGVISTFCNISIQGYRKPFWGVLTTAIDLNNLTSAAVRSLPYSGNSTKGLPTSLYVDEGACQVIFCAKAGTYSSVTANDKLAQNASITFTKHTNKVDVADLNGENTTAYDIFEVTWPGPIASAKDLILSWK